MLQKNPVGTDGQSIVSYPDNCLVGLWKTMKSQIG